MTIDPTTPPWQALLAPLPHDARARERPLAPPELLASPEGAALAGMRSLVLDLSAPGRGNRVVMVMLDEAGRLLSASDSVTHRSEHAAPGGGPPLVRFVGESVGGSFDEAGRLRGTRWRSESEAPHGADVEPGDIRSTPRPPSDEEAAALRALALEVVRRWREGR